MPDSLHIDVADEFAKVASDAATLRKVADGFRFLEGPVWVRDRLIFSDIPSNRLHAWRPDEGVEIFREPSHNTNGNTLDPAGHLLSCEHGTRLVSITEPALGGERRVLVETFTHHGKPTTPTKFNSPNDVVVHPASGRIYFTDPYWGLPGDRRAELMEYGPDQCWVFCCDGDGGNPRPVVKDFQRPNGLAFSPDARQLYIADDQRRHIRRFDVGDDGTLSGGDVFCEIDPGVPDGIRVDVDGRLFSTAGDGVHVFLPDGTRIGKILCPETPANCAFGGRGHRTLFLTARTGLYAIDLKVMGAR